MPESVSPLAVHPRVIEIVVDCRDPKSLATFWSELLKIDIKGEIREGHLWFVARCPSVRAARRAIDLGARQLAAHDERGRQWRVMADPEDNEFCLTL